MILVRKPKPATKPYTRRIRDKFVWLDVITTNEKVKVYILLQNIHIIERYGWHGTKWEKTASFIKLDTNTVNLSTVNEMLNAGNVKLDSNADRSLAYALCAENSKYNDSPVK